MVAAAVVGGSLIGGIMSSNAQSDASENASNAQIQSSREGIAQQNKQFEAIQKLLSPYSTAGTGALTQQQNMLGLNGDNAQQLAINGIRDSSQFNVLAAQGEQGILQNASATGGLRGGNVQGALAQFRPQLLNQLIDQQYSRLGGLTSIGQNAAAGVGNAGMQTGNQITQLLGQQGAAQAGNALAQGQSRANMYSGVSNSLGTFAGMGGFAGFGGIGGGSGVQSPYGADGANFAINPGTAPIPASIGQIPSF